MRRSPTTAFLGAPTRPSLEGVPMLTIARWSVRHRKLIIAAWIAALVLLMGASRAAGDQFANNLTLPGTDSTHGVDLLKSSFPAAAGDQDQIVFHTGGGEA